MRCPVLQVEHDRLFDEIGNVEDGFDQHVPDNQLIFCLYY